MDWFIYDRDLKLMIELKAKEKIVSQLREKKTQKPTNACSRSHMSEFTNAILFDNYMLLNLPAFTKYLQK